MASRYWVGGTGSWSATNTVNWSATSGGAGGASVPTNPDDVFLDANSGTGTITLAASLPCRNIDCTGYTGGLAGGGFTLNIYGPVATFVSGMTVSSLGVGYFFSSATSQVMTLTSGGKSFAGLNCTPAGAGQGLSGVTLADALSVTGTITHGSGVLNTGNFNITCALFVSSNSNVRTLTLGTSVITINSTGAGAVVWDMQTMTNLTVTANTATAVITGSTGQQFRATGTVSFNGLSLSMTGALSPILNVTAPGMLNFTRTGTASKLDGLSVAANFTCTGIFSVSGNSAVNRVVVSSNTVGTQRTISAASTSFSNVDFTDIAGAGAGNWDLSSISGLAGDAGGNSAIIFPAGQTNYWVGGGANWSNPNHWALGSGVQYGAAGNLLVGDASNFDGGTNLWSASASNCTSVVTSTQALSGTKSLASTVTAAGAASQWGPTVAVTPGQVYLLMAYVRSSVSRTVAVSADLKLSGVYVSSAISLQIPSSTTGWTLLTNSILIPAGVNQLTIIITTASNAAGDVHYIDNAGIYNIGSPGRVPLPQDNVIFDANSFSPGTTVTSDMPRLGSDIDFSGVTNSPLWTMTISSGVTMYGSLTLMTSGNRGGWSGSLTFGGRGTHNITTNTRSLPGATWNSPGATYTLQDDMNMLTAILTLNYGTLNLNGKTVTCGNISSSNAFTRSLLASGSTINLGGTGGVVSINSSISLTTNSATVFNITNVTATSKTFTLNKTWLGTLNYTVANTAASTLIIGAQAGTGGTIVVGSGTSLFQKTLQFTSASTTALTDLQVTGTPSTPVIVNSTTAGTTATVSLPAGVYTERFTSISDITITGATLVRSLDSTLVSNAIGFTSATTYYVKSTGGNLVLASAYSADQTNKATGATAPAAPTTVDDISFESNSGNVTLPSSSLTYRNLTMQTGYSGTITFSATGGMTASGDVTLVNTAVFSGSATGTFNFIGIALQTLTSAGKTWPLSINLNSVGGTLSLADALNSSATLTFTAGTFTTNNFNVTAFSFTTGSSTKVLNFGTSTLTAGTGGTFTLGGSLTTLNAASATLVTTAVGSATLSFPSGSAIGTLNTSATTAITIGIAVTVDTFVRSTTTVGASVTLGGTLTVTGIFTAGGTTSAYQTMQSTAYATGRSLILTGAVINCSNMIFEDIFVTGGPVTGSNIGDAGNISGITATIGTTLYRVGGTNTTWNNTSTWALTSGGPATARIPLPQDDVVIDNNSTAAQLGGFALQRLCRNLTITRTSIGIVLNPGTTSFYVHGNISFTSLVSVNPFTTVVMRRANTTGGLSVTTVTSGGAAWNAAGLTIDRIVGTHTTTLTDALTLGGAFNLTTGSFNSAGFPMSCSVFSSNTAISKTLTISNSTISLTGSGTVWNTAGTMTLVSNTSTLIDILDTSGTFKSVNNTQTTTATLRYAANNVANSTLQVGLSTSGTRFPTIVVNNGGSTFQKTIKFFVVSTAITDLQITGNVMNPVAIASTTAGSAAGLTKASGTITVQYVTMQDIAASGGANFIALDSTDVSGNSGWKFANTGKWGVPIRA